MQETLAGRYMVNKSGTAGIKLTYALKYDPRGMWTILRVRGATNPRPHPRQCLWKTAAGTNSHKVVFHLPKIQKVHWSLTRRTWREFVLVTFDGGLGLD